MSIEKSKVGVECTCPECKTKIFVGVTKKQAKTLYKAYKGWKH